MYARKPVLGKSSVGKSLKSETMEIVKILLKAAEEIIDHLDKDKKA